MDYSIIRRVAHPDRTTDTKAGRFAPEDCGRNGRHHLWPDVEEQLLQGGRFVPPDRVRVRVVREVASAGARCQHGGGEAEGAGDAANEYVRKNCPGIPASGAHDIGYDRG